jgi:hypothetical protein
VRKVRREELLDWVTWSERRDELRPAAMRQKDLRRVLVGPYLTFLFENADTVRYQVQEMLRVERIVREADIEHELATYNELIGGAGEIGATLLVGIDDAKERERLLTAWVDLPEHLWLRLDDGRVVRPAIDERQRERGRLSSVQYLKFPTGGEAPVSVGCDLPGLAAETPLAPEQREALRRDLAAGADRAQD